MLTLMVSHSTYVVNLCHHRSPLNPPDQVHDWLILLNHEVKHIWREKWGLGKILYCISRYGPFLDVPIVITSESDFIFVLIPHGKFCHVIVHTAPYATIDYDVRQCHSVYWRLTNTDALDVQHPVQNCHL